METEAAVASNDGAHYLITRNRFELCAEELLSGLQAGSEATS